MFAPYESIAACPTFQHRSFQSWEVVTYTKLFGLKAAKKINDRLSILLGKAGLPVELLMTSSMGGDVKLMFPVKPIDKTFSNELVYDAIVGDGFD